MNSVEQNKITRFMPEALINMVKFQTVKEFKISLEISNRMLSKRKTKKFFFLNRNVANGFHNTDKIFWKKRRKKNHKTLQIKILFQYFD